MSSNTDIFKKENIDRYFNELSKAYKKLGGRKMPAEIILIGGAAIIENYGFRDMTTDIDAVINAASAMDDAIKQVGDKFNLSCDWLNNDFSRTSSYSNGLSAVSTHYKSFNQILDVRTVNSEYLIAMKLKSGRTYKHDLSDIIGILYEHEKKDDSITFERIENAVIALYDSWDNIPDFSVNFIKDALKNGNYKSVYSTVSEKEKEAKKALIEFQEQAPNELNQKKADEILESIQSKASVLEQLKKLKKKSGI